MKKEFLKKKSRLSLQKIYVALVFLFLYAPIFVLIAFSFNESKSRITWSGFTLKWYGRLFHDVEILRSLSNTILVAVVSALLATLLGTVAAIGINVMKKKAQKLVMNITNIPMLSPEIVTGVSMMIMFGLIYKSTGLLKPGLITLIIAHTTFCLPYVALSVMPKLKQLNPNLYEAALDLGCTPLSAFFKVILPEIFSGIITGGVMAFTLSIDDFVISYFVSGTTQTLPIAIYSMTRKIVSPEINALSTILFSSVLVLMLIINFGLRKDKRTLSSSKKVLFTILGFLFIFENRAFAAENTKVINVYSWGEYISNGLDGNLDVNAEFTKRTGIKVNYTTFQDNESLFAKLSSGVSSYDVIIPSDYMISKLIRENMLSEINFENVPNFSNVQEEFRNPVYDPENKYSVPYTWGVIGIFYNKKKVEESVDKISWDILWNEKYKGQILMFDNPRDAFAIAQIKLGLSVNSSDENSWIKASFELKRQKPLVQTYVMDQIFDKMGNNEAALAPYYDGDAKILTARNPDLGFVIPKEGTVKFVDAMCIPKNSEHKLEAESYINFMCEEYVARANANYIGYSSPCVPVDSSYSDILKNAQTFSSLPEETNSLLDDLWVQVKTGDRNSSVILVIVLIGFLMLYVGCVMYKKNKRSNFN